MKPKSLFPLFLLVGLSGPALAETISPQATACPMSGAVADATDLCMAMRVAFRTELGDCTTRMKAAADMNSGMSPSNTPQSARARFLLCSAEVRQKLGLEGQ